jgi:DeoD family purine-nucleoside phosphorylase
VSHPEPESPAAEVTAAVDPPVAAANPKSPPTAPAYPQALHIHPTAALAERVLLPGDPGRALMLAQALITKPQMFNHHRGLWGYTGPARADGKPLTIQATGMGGPSAAIVLSELISLGARRAIRVGTCGALSPELELGELVIARESICHDGASRALVAGERWPIGDPVDLRSVADPTLTQALVSAAPDAYAGSIVSVDLFYDDDARSDHSTGALAVEMESATLFAIGARAGVPVACLLAVSDTFAANGMRTRIDDHALLSAAEAMGVVAVTALTA